MKPLTKAMRRAKQIPPGAKTKAKSKAVHAWVLAVKEMFQKGHN